MSQIKEDDQKRQLAMARQAAALQQELLARLLSMDEKTRSETLEDAKRSHDDFLREVSGCENMI